MTIPTIEELENELTIDTASSFKETPLSKDSIKEWRLYFEREGLILKDNELIEKVQANPSPEEHEDILQDRRRKREIEVNHHSDFVNEIMKQEGITNDMDGVIDEADEL